MLRKHLEYLLTRDPGFASFWEKCSPLERQDFIKRSLDIIEAGESVKTDNRFDCADFLLRKLFLIIPEVDMVRSRIDRDWLSFAVDEEAKRSVYDVAEISFKEHLAKFGLADIVSLYGGLKTSYSMRRKAVERNPSSLVDLWDVVRFRMVVPDLRGVLVVSLRIYDEYADALLKCRNYYSRPKVSLPRHPYRAVHFQIDIHEKMVELQVMTLAHETVSCLDHSISFKGSLKPLSQDHRDWLERLRLGALIVDHSALPGSICSPADLIRAW